MVRFEVDSVYGLRPPGTLFHIHGCLCAVDKTERPSTLAPLVQTCIQVIYLFIFFQMHLTRYKDSPSYTLCVTLRQVMPEALHALLLVCTSFAAGKCGLCPA